MPADSSRRDFIRAGAALALGASLPSGGAAAAARPSHAPEGADEPFRAPPMAQVRIGFVGVGGQGTTHVENMLDLNGNLYPTHTLGPAANCMDISRGDRFQTVVSMSSPSRGLQFWQAEKYSGEFDHPLWRSERIQRMDRGHGGMDFLEDYRLVECLRRGEPTDANVYDAAALSSMVELSIRSVAARGKPQEVPDFTRGRWKTRAPWPIVEA